MLRSLMYLLIGIIFVLTYLRYFEYKSLYFPMREIELVPSAAGLAYEDIYLRTDDGIELNAWFIPAKDSKFTPLDSKHLTGFTLLFCHGNGGNISHRIEKILILNALGLDVFIFDYHGYGRSNGRPSERGLYKDAQAAYRYLIEERNISPSRIILYGESLGGAIAVDLGIKKVTKALIIESAFTSAPDVAKVVYPFFPAFLISSKFDTLSKINKTEIPKLIIHSKNDEIIPFSQSLKLFDASPSPKKHLVLVGSHNTCYMDSKDLYVSGIHEFLEGL